MSPENILNSSLLDIVFQNRHKEYGAYQLRKTYPQRLYISLAVMTSLVVVFSVLSNLPSGEPQFAQSIAEIDTVRLIEIPNGPPKPIEPPARAENRAMVKNSVPIIVKEADVTEVPENDVPHRP